MVDSYVPNVTRVVGLFFALLPEKTPTLWYRGYIYRYTTLTVQGKVVITICSDSFWLSISSGPGTPPHTDSVNVQRQEARQTSW